MVVRPGHTVPMMSSRLVPWCLAAMAFTAALTLTWHHAPDDSGRPQAEQGAVVDPTPAVVTQDFGLDVPRAFAIAWLQGVDTPVSSMVLPLPRATQPEIFPGIEPVPDDEPAVQDLPEQRNAELAGDE